MINIDKLREELTFDEGCLYEIYEDHLGYATFGIGHLVLDSDAEFGKEIGTPVSEERVIECFEQDIENVFNDLDRNISWWRDLSEDLQRVVANMWIQNGRNRLETGQLD
jgi:GH24 family phage-related lysozyme (muramidase)